MTEISPSLARENTRITTSKNSLKPFTPLISSYTPPYRNYRMMRINNTNNENNQLFYDIRKVQNSRGCLMISLPKKFSRWLRLEPGIPMKIEFDSDKMIGNRLIISRVNIDIQHYSDNNKTRDQRIE